MGAWVYFRYGLVLYQNGCYGNRNGCIVLYIILDRVGESCKRVGEREGDVECRAAFHSIAAAVSEILLGCRSTPSADFPNEAMPLCMFN